MALNQFKTDNQFGKKLSFADWISNISPEDTVFQTSIGSESIDQIKFSWQIDTLDPVAVPGTSDNAAIEGSAADLGVVKPTKEISNQVQMLRKVVTVTDTANGTANYGRGRELAYQMVKSSKSIKRDLEAALLGNGPQKAATATVGRTFGGFKALVGETGTGAAGTGTVNQTGHTGTRPDDDTGAVVVKTALIGDVVTGTASATNPLTIADGSLQAFEDAVLDLTAELYKANSKADTIMVHPSMAPSFSKLLEKYGAGSATSNSTNRVRYFENSKSLDLEVNEITTPLGQKFKLVFNRFMPVESTGVNYLYFFTPADWDKMVFRAPKVVDIAKLGSAETKMIEMEVSLRHRNPYASGVLAIGVKP